MAEHTGGVSYKEGIVKAAKPGFARVQFPDLDNLVSAWLPLVVRKSLRDKECFTLDEGEQVACVLDEYFEDGCVLGAIYSDADAPPVDSPDKLHFRFFDGGLFEYDRASGTLTIETSGPVNVIAGGLVTLKAPSVTVDTPEASFTGNVTIAGGLNQGEGSGGDARFSANVWVKGDVTGGATSLQNHTHTEQGDGAETSDAH